MSCHVERLEPLARQIPARRRWKHSSFGLAVAYSGKSRVKTTYPTSPYGELSRGGMVKKWNTPMSKYSLQRKGKICPSSRSKCRRPNYHLVRWRCPGPLLLRWACSHWSSVVVRKHLDNVKLLMRGCWWWPSNLHCNIAKKQSGVFINTSTDKYLVKIEASTSSTKSRLAIAYFECTPCLKRCDPLSPGMDVMCPPSVLLSLLPTAAATFLTLLIPLRLPISSMPMWSPHWTRSFYYV